MAGKKHAQTETSELTTLTPLSICQSMYDN